MQWFVMPFLTLFSVWYGEREWKVSSSFSVCLVWGFWKRSLKPSGFKSLPNGENLNSLSFGGFQVFTPKALTFIFLKKKNDPQNIFAIFVFN